MKICIYSAKGGEGKTPIATNIALDREYAIGTNEHFQLFDSFIPDNRLIALQSGESFPEIPSDIDIVFDLAGSISAHEASIVSALNQSDIVIIPISNEVKALNAGIGTIKEVLEFSKNILVVATKLEKGRKEKFNGAEWNKSLSFLNIKDQVDTEIHNHKIPCLPLKFSKAFDAIFEKEMSISQMMDTDPLAKYNYRDVAAQFNDIYEMIDEVENYAK